MPLLARNSTRLLHRVQNKPHATQKDHHDALPTPPPTNSTRSSDSQSKMNDLAEDVTRSPVSSDDERAPAASTFTKPSNVDGAADAQPAAAQFKPLSTRRFDNDGELPQKAWEQPSRRSLRSPESTRSKRSHESDEQGSSDADCAIFSSQSSVKRQRTSVPNIHAAPPKAKIKYGRGSQRARRPSSNESKKPTKAEKRVEDEPQVPKFQQAQGIKDMFEFRGEQDAQPTFMAREPNADALARNSLSPSLSSLSSVPDSPDVEEVAALDLKPATPYNATVDCDICGAKVDKPMKQNYEDRFTKGKAMSFKWQQRFCLHHQQENAKRRWGENGWPDIDWPGLETRMRKFDDHLRDVICNRVESKWKDDLQRHMRPLKSKFPEVNAQEVKMTAWTGYYGPRGERAMSEHIVRELSDDLRQRASKDKIVAAAGVKGGMSGFVHGVLVPELACRLIAEDLGIEPDDARITVGASGMEGVLLNPDLDETISGRGREEEDEVGEE